jgi:4-amino-4-deoxy-L-arabinose transferase-like glycosyltransferase
VLTGVGLGIGYLGNGLIAAGMVVALVAALPLASPAWRSRSLLHVAAVAAACAAPFLLAWPLSAALAAEAAQASTRGVGYFLKQLSWYAWPAWPLSAWALWRARRDLAQRSELHLPLVALAVFFVAVAAFGEGRDVSLLPLLVPLAILGVAELESLPRGAASALDWFGVMTFFLIGVLLWVVWGAALTGAPDAAASAIQKELPGFTYRFNFIAFALAALLTLVWVVVVARSLRSARRALVNWAAGITMVWMLLMTLGTSAGERSAQLSHRGHPARRRGAARCGMHRAPQRRRRAARAARLFREGAHRARRATRRRALRRAPSPGPTRSESRSPAPGGRKPGAARAPATATEMFVLYRKASG